MTYKIEHDRPGCIGCGACAAVSPQFWTMDPNDGKSDLVGSEKIKEGNDVKLETMTIDEDKFKPNKEAADVCPVNVIHLFDAKGNKII